MARAVAEGIPKLRIEECAARRQARIDSGRVQACFPSRKAGIPHPPPHSHSQSPSHPHPQPQPHPPLPSPIPIPNHIPILNPIPIPNPTHTDLKSPINSLLSYAQCPLGQIFFLKWIIGINYLGYECDKVVIHRALNSVFQWIRTPHLCPSVYSIFNGSLSMELLI